VYKFGELATYYQKKGLKETLLRIKTRYISILTFVLYCRDLREPFQNAVFDDNMKIIADDFELLDLDRQLRKDLPREFYIDKTHQGKNFYLFFFQGHLAGICWIFKKGDYSRFFKIENGTSCELNYIITLPEFRGNRLSSRFVNHICEMLEIQKFRFVFLSVSLGNVLSHKTFVSSGFKEQMRVRSFFSYVRKVTI
jgi:hypothetical protein